MPNGMLALAGVTPVPEAKTFRVFIRIDENGRYVLRTAYPAKQQEKPMRFSGLGFRDAVSVQQHPQRLTLILERPNPGL
ncbi:MAG: hypothetical protein V1792_02225 [Pseudomonadota bacterium]